MLTDFVRIDPPKEFATLQYYKIMFVILEIAHIFCTTHEIKSAGKLDTSASSELPQRSFCTGAVFHRR